MLSNVRITTDAQMDALLDMLSQIGWRQQEAQPVSSPSGVLFQHSSCQGKRSLVCQSSLSGEQFDALVGELAAVTEWGAPDVTLYFTEPDIDWVNREFTDCHYTVWLLVSEGQVSRHEMRVEAWPYEIEDRGAYERARQILEQEDNR